MKRGISFLVTLTLVLIFPACETDPSIYDLVKDMLVQSGYDKTVNFSSYTTYSMPMDTLGLIYNADPTDTLVTGTYAQAVTSQIKLNLDQAGYARVDLNQNPDLGINVFVVRDYEIYQTIVYPGSFSGYPGYYYPGYYGYQSYYGYPYVNYSSSDQASLVIELVDLKNQDSQGRVKVIWTSYIGDLLTSIDLNQKSLEAIDQAFAQSAYLKK